MGSSIAAAGQKYIYMAPVHSLVTPDDVDDVTQYAQSTFVAKIFARVGQRQS